MIHKPTSHKFTTLLGPISIAKFASLLLTGMVIIMTAAEAATEKVSPAIDSSTLLNKEPQLLPQPPEEFPGKAVPAPLRDLAVIQQSDKPILNTVINVKLESLEEVEIKSVLAAHKVIFYSWSTSGEVYYDFHAEPAVGPEGYFVRYAEGESMEDSGSLVAPFTGHHGWYWLNISEKPVTINLQVDGYHKELIEVFRNKR
jgi:hypothetical protein